MKKIVIGVLAVIVLFIGIKFIPSGSKNVYMGASLVYMEVPKLSSLDSECCNYEATFKSLRSKDSIKKELDKIMSTKQILLCDGNKYYYDMTNDITIKEYDVTGGLIFTKFHISYVKGYACSFE